MFATNPPIVGPMIQERFPTTRKIPNPSCLCFSGRISAIMASCAGWATLDSKPTTTIRGKSRLNSVTSPNVSVLTALKTSLEGPDAKFLFVPFKDDTNGRETYEVGRFIDLEEPEGDEVILDFNRCYNPLCNYSPAYNCPLPPLENFLDVEIKAGEKAYPH